MPNGKRLYSWTLNNYDEAELVSLRTSLSQESQVRYAVFGYETGKEQTPHLQGYVAFVKQKSLTAAKKILGLRAHLEVCLGNEKQNIDYCKKGEQSHEEWKAEGTSGSHYGLNAKFEEFGTPQRDQGKRNDLKEFQSLVESGELSLKRLRKECPDVTAKYPRYVEQFVRDQFEKPVPEMYTLRPWHVELLELLKGDICPRRIIFVVDPNGKAGKSWFCDYYEYIFENSYLGTPGKKADMIYAFYSACVQPRVVFLDAPKSTQGDEEKDWLNYGFLEELKNGRMMNTKYNSEMFYFKVPHVVVMMNRYPDESKLSSDRYHIIDVPNFQ